MPIYEYKCHDCGTVNEVLVRNTSVQSSVECPECRSANVSKLVSAPAAVMVKGSSAADIPPISCPKMGQCGVPSGSCPAANSQQ